MGSTWMMLPNLAVKDQVAAWNLCHKSNTFSMPFLLPSQFTSFDIEKGKVEEGQLMVMESCANGMRNV